jgi:hypothetical protein
MKGAARCNSSLIFRVHSTSIAALYLGSGNITFSEDLKRPIASLAFTAVLIVFPEPTDESEFVFKEAAVLIVLFALNELLQFPFALMNVSPCVIRVYNTIHIVLGPFIGESSNTPGNTSFLCPLSR